MRITLAVGILAVATALVVAAVVVGGAALVATSAGFALLSGWVALRLAWSAVVLARYEHAADRAELARTYRQLFAERAVENHAFTKAMTLRIRERDQAIRELENRVVDTSRRAVVAETSVTRVQRRLADAQGRIVTLEDYLAKSQAEHRAALERLAAAESSVSPISLVGPGASESVASSAPAEPPARRTVVPEWADLETDPTAALMAWEEHAQQHVQGAKHVADDRIPKQA